MASRIRDLEGLIKKMELKLKNLEATTLIVSENISKKKEELNAITKKIHEQNNESLNVLFLIEELLHKIETLNATVLKKEKEISRQEKIIDGNNKKLSETIGTIIENKSIIENMTEHIDTLSNSKEDIEIDILSLWKSIKHSSKELEKNKSELGKIKKEEKISLDNLKKAEKTYTSIKDKHSYLDLKISEVTKREKNLNIKEKRYHRLRFNK